MGNVSGVDVAEEKRPWWKKWVTTPLRIIIEILAAWQVLDVLFARVAGPFGLVKEWLRLNAGPGLIGVWALVMVGLGLLLWDGIRVGHRLFLSEKIGVKDEVKLVLNPAGPPPDAKYTTLVEGMDAAITQHGLRLVDPTLSLSLPDLFDRFLKATEKTFPLIADGWAVYQRSQRRTTSEDVEAFRRAARSREWAQRVEKDAAKAETLISKPFTEAEYADVRNAFRTVCKDVFEEHKALRRFVMGRQMHPNYDEHRPHLADLDKRVQAFAAALDALNVDANRKVGKAVVDVPKDFHGLSLG